MGDGVLKLNPEQIAALQAQGITAVNKDTKIPDVRPPHPLIARICSGIVMLRAFGPTMKPTFRQRLLLFPSHGAMAQAYLSHQWREKCRAGTG